MSDEPTREAVLELVRRFAEREHAPAAFEPGVTPVPVSGKVFDAADVATLVDSALDFWLTTGRFSDDFERRFARLLGRRHAMLCNSGSSANLLALTSLTSHRLGERGLKPGDEVLTAAAGFPTTVNPIVQAGLVPVFVDGLPLEGGTFNVDPQALADAVGPRTRAIMIAHTLGNPYDIGAVSTLARERSLWWVEDNCDGLGSTYDGRLTGTFGDLATSSFYPAHHITMGEGGCVITDRPSLKKIVESFRDWGRDCWCDPGKEDTCGKRYGWQLGSLPAGFDHKYIYSHIGYNLKLTDMQAAVGVSQLDKLEGFTAARKRNFAVLREGLAGLEEFLILPNATPGSEPSWFGFPVAVRPGAPFTRSDLVLHLEGRLIRTRMLFAGNLMRQPAYRDVPSRVHGDLRESDRVMEHAFWVGCYPGLTPEMLAFMVEEFHAFCRKAAA